MELHVALPNGDADATAEDLVEIAVRSEELGYKALWALDHVLVGPSLRSRYTSVFEPMVTLAHAAARTRTLRLGTSVIVLPMRSPFVLAKQVATLDQLSGGRAILGLGVGYAEDEFRNVGADFHRRGRRTEEAIHLFRHLFGGSEGPFRGEFYGYEEGWFGPLPVQRERLPIMIGGGTDAALRRAARLADMWQATSTTPDRFRRRLAFLREEADGRPLQAGARVRLEGDAERMRAELAEWEAAGADHVAISFPPVQGFVRRMEALAAAL